MPCDLRQVTYFRDDTRKVTFYKCEMKINHRFARFYKKFTGKSLRRGRFWIHPLSIAVAEDVAQIKSIEEEYQTVLQQARDQGFDVSSFPNTLLSFGHKYDDLENNMPFPNYLVLCAAHDNAPVKTDRLIKIFEYLLSVDNRLVNTCHHDSIFPWNYYLSVLDLVKEMGTDYKPLFDFLIKAGAHCTLSYRNKLTIQDSSTPHGGQRRLSMLLSKCP